MLRFPTSSIIANITIWFCFYHQVSAKCTSKFDPLEWLGGNSPWFAGPDVFGIPDEIPNGCEVDQAALVVRHGSRYPDPGAYNEWLRFYEKIRSSNLTAKGPLSFLPTWKPINILHHPKDQLGQLSLTGYKELHALGTTTRLRYPNLYQENTPFTIWANAFPRTIDSARLFSQGFAGPSSSLVDIVTVNGTYPESVGNSLTPSDLCKNYKDDSGGELTKAWERIYLPPVRERVNGMIVNVQREGEETVFKLTDEDMSLFPYLCGFETQILGRRSAFCGVLLERELRGYEYRQDLRYWYGTGPGSNLPPKTMLPFLQSLTEILLNGPKKTYKYKNPSTGKTQPFTPPPLIVAFTHDNQINELAAVSGVFDAQRSLPIDAILEDRIFVSSRINPMRGTIAFERLSCKSNQEGSTIEKRFIRILLNDAIYPIVTCQSGPSRSCPLEEYVQLIQEKVLKAGSFVENCGMSNDTGGTKTTFLTDLGLPWLKILKA